MCNWSLITHVPPSTTIPSGTRDYQKHYYTRNVYHTHAHLDSECSALEQLTQFFRENLNDAKEKGYTEANINVICTRMQYSRIIAMYGISSITNMDKLQVFHNPYFIN